MYQNIVYGSTIILRARREPNKPIVPSPYIPEGPGA
jgi:hypothetical protein